MEVKYNKGQAVIAVGGDPMNLITQETCPIPEYRFIPLGKELFAKVDVDDFDWLNQWKWKPDYIKQTNSF